MSVAVHGVTGDGQRPVCQKCTAGHRHRDQSTRTLKFKIHRAGPDSPILSPPSHICPSFHCDFSVHAFNDRTSGCRGATELRSIQTLRPSQQHFQSHVIQSSLCQSSGRLLY